ncbi:uncharacterized protein BO66DRAFT_391414 [Aspergillus aculeatinus CBS 121060]|uniref:Uncharacterized protein n=1 Tax=Aspergillus aculeatinus CBS 121060 TaxID=1448322 RepID=A0ACD1HBC7_9EURO|nr:hypothetical protein BO66DRAFT_391414 [Aspergillus aculeatinus CBS 121060]RAH70970.1 hypothetical protein BO66DRAFT_391414 [Aspergillus aculeatinus CBS 121060]
MPCSQAQVHSHIECHEAVQMEAFPISNLDAYNWKELENRYNKAMEQHKEAENALQNHILRMLEIFMAWSQTTITRDETRAFKRFKTQMQHVQNSEASLENKKRHYTDVVKAFESALALLDDRL